MKKDIKLRKVMGRVGHILERSGFRISYCAGILSETFDITADSIYSVTKDSGTYIKIAIDAIPKEQFDAILNYGTHRKKELWILRHGKSSTDPGVFLIYRIDGEKIIEHPQGWPIEKVFENKKDTKLLKKFNTQSEVKSQKTAS